MLDVVVPLAVPYVATITGLLALGLAGVLVIWAPSRASAYDAETRLNRGATVSLAYVNVGVAGRGVLSSKAGRVIVVLRVVALLAITAVPLAMRGKDVSVYGERETALRLGRAGKGVRAGLRQRMVEKVQGVCRRNGADGATVIYEMYDPQNAATEEALPGIEQRAFCAEPGVVEDVRLLYVSNVEAQVLVPVDTLAPMEEGKAKNKDVRVWGGVESITSAGAMACAEVGKESLCLYAGEASSENIRAFTVLRNKTRVRRVSDVPLEGSPKWTAVNVTGMDNGVVERGLRRLVTFAEEEGGTRDFDETIMLMDMVGPSPGAKIRRRTGMREATSVSVWALVLLGVLYALAIALLFFFGAATGQKSRMNAFAWAVRELMRPGSIADPALTTKERSGERTDLLYLSGERGKDKSICRRDFDPEQPRRFTGT